MNTLLTDVAGRSTVAEAYRILEEGAEPTADALELTVILKRAEAALAAMRAKLLSEANKVFVTIQTTEKSDKKSWEVRGAEIKKFTPAGNWTFTPAIYKLERELKQKKDAAKKDKTAKKSTPTVDPNSQSLFSVSL